MSDNPIVNAIERQDWLEPVQREGSEWIKRAFAACGPQGETVKKLLHGEWLGHPLHSAITDVPVGSWTVAAALDVLSLSGQEQYDAGADAAVLVGLLGAVPAALSGMTDWSETKGSPQRLGAIHGILNIAAAASYLSSYAARKSQRRGFGRCLGFLGFGFVLASAYLGGELTYGLRVNVKDA